MIRAYRLAYMLEAIVSLIINTTDMCRRAKHEPIQRMERDVADHKMVFKSARFILDKTSNEIK